MIARMSPLHCRKKRSRSRSRSKEKEKKDEKKLVIEGAIGDDSADLNTVSQRW
mgnify:FL=1